jgi:hypothetical protein
MKALAKALITGASVIAVALVCIGCGASGSGASVVAQASASGLPTPAALPSAAVVAEPTASAAPAPSAAPSVTSGISSLAQATYVACDPKDTGKSCLAAGTYRLSGGAAWPVTVTIDVPAGWFEWDPGWGGADAVLVQGGPEDGYSGTGWGIVFTTVADVSRDPCDSSKGVIPAAQVDTPKRLAAAMAEWPRFKTTATRPITVDGHTGLKFEMTSTAPTSCSSSGSLWRTTSGGLVDVYPMINDSGPSAPATFEIVDTGHGLVVMRSTDFPRTSPAELKGKLAELDAILDSVRLTAQPG